MMIEVPVTEYRAHLRRWHERVRRGEEVVVTDNGRPVVRVVPAGGDGLLERLERDGLLRRGRPRRPAEELDPQPAPGDSTADVSEARDR